MSTTASTASTARTFIKAGIVEGSMDSGMVTEVLQGCKEKDLHALIGTLRTPTEPAAGVGDQTSHLLEIDILSMCLDTAIEFFANADYSSFESAALTASSKFSYRARMVSTSVQ